MHPASAIAPNIWVAVSQSTRLCSRSTVSQAKPVRARSRAARMLPSDSHVPAAGWFALSARLTGFARIFPRSIRSYCPAIELEDQLPCVLVPILVQNILDAGPFFCNGQLNEQ